MLNKDLHGETPSRSVKTKKKEVPAVEVSNTFPPDSVIDDEMMTGCVRNLATELVLRLLNDRREVVW